MINFRKYIFYLKDRVKGGPITKHLRDIELILNAPHAVDSISKIDIRKTALLNHAVKNVPFYRQNVADGEIARLSSFPVINKNIIRDNLNDFVADGQQIDKLSKVVTSGSTGTPFVVYQDFNKRARNTADTIYFGALAGYTIGTQLNYLKIWTSVNKKNKFKSLAENLVPIDVTRLSHHEIGKLIANIEKSNCKKAFLGYASALESIVNYLEINNPNFRFSNVTSVMAMSEAISENTKKLIRKYFGVNCVSRYSNVENGIIAQQKNDGTAEFRLNLASYGIEILAMDNDEPVRMGIPGRIVITDYFNHAMPLIRYDTGDVGILGKGPDNNVVLTKIEGRKMDMVFDTTGNLVSSFTITNNMWLYPEVRQYQFIQLSKNSYKFRLNVENDFRRDAELINEFKKHFGIDADITVEYVNEIPLLNSGKRRKVINEYYV